MTDSAPTPPLRPNILIDPARTSGTEQRPTLVIVSLPQALQRTEKPTVITGKIVEIKSDGTVRIATPNGDIVARPEKPLSLADGTQVEIRLPKGDPPETANIRPAPPERPQRPPTQTPVQNAPVKLPPQITVQDLIEKVENIVLKNLPPQQVAKIIVPYLNIINTALPEIAQQIPIDLLTPQTQTAQPQTLQNPLPQITPLPEFTPSIAPIAIKIPPATSVITTKIIAQAVEQDSVLITPAQGLLSFLKKQNTDDLVKTKLLPLPVDIPPRSLLLGLISKPLIQPITAPATQNLQAPLIPETLPLISNTPFEIISIFPPVVMQTAPPTFIQTGTPQPPAEALVQSPITIPLTKLAEIPLVKTPERSEILPQLPAIDSLSNSTAPTLDIRNAQPTLTFTQPPKLDTIQAVVVGYTPEQNFPVLKIIKPETRADQFFALELPVRDIPLGTQIELRPQQTLPSQQTQISAPSTLIAAPVLPLSYFLTPEGWTTLREVQTALTQTAPQIATAFNNVIPQASNPQQLGSAALFFLAALRSGDLSNWMGDKAIDALKKSGKGDLLTRLSSELSSLSRLSSESASQEWRMATIPLNWNNDIQKIVIHYKKDGRNDDPENKKNGGGTRFLMNLNLSQIGPLQLDGLFQADKKRLDLMLRTQTAFSAPVQGEMQRLYKEALGETEYTGDLSFQNKAEQWVHITPANRKSFSEKI